MHNVFEIIFVRFPNQKTPVELRCKSIKRMSTLINKGMSLYCLIELYLLIIVELHRYNRIIPFEYSRK